MLGRSLGPYEILGPLGAGGMGEVHRAHDARLRRDVAIKVLPAELAADSDRLARLEREAQLLAALNHPNVATIHGLEEAETDSGASVRFLVLELVEGQTLAERLRSGPLEVDEALEIGRQIARGLEAAHEKGIVHRDLKPGNIKITPAGLVKVLDFGLAKPMGSTGSGQMAGESSDEERMSRSPTVTVAGTAAGVVLGTAAYMSPEQARGKPVDRRTDIWSFGCVLFETLTGRRPFDGETVSDTMAAILKEDPDWESLPPELPSGPRLALLQCLQKEPRQRLHDIADVRLGLESAWLDSMPGLIAPRPAPAATDGQPSGAPRWLMSVWIAVAFIALLIATILWMQPDPAPPAVRRTTIQLPAALHVTLSSSFQWPAALAPDGSFIVYSALEDGRRQLYLRPLDRYESRPIAGTEGGSDPFISFDGLWLAFAADNRIKKVPMEGGAALAIHEVGMTPSFGGTWAADDTIVFTPSIARGLYRVSAAGGEGAQLTEPDAASGEIGHVWPRGIPGTDKVLFTVQKGDGFDVAILSLKDNSWTTVLEGAHKARYLPSGHLVYRADVLQAVAFDLAEQRVIGTPTALFPATWFDIASDGTLAYTNAGREAGGLVWVDREGSVTPVAGGESAGAHPRIAPGGGRVAFEAGIMPDIYVLDRKTGGLTRISFAGNINNFAVWSPDGSEIVFNSTRSPNGLYRKRWDAPGEAELFLLRPPQRPQIPASWSEEHGIIAYTEIHEVTKEDVWIVPAGGGDSSPLIVTPFRERVPMVSPDGRWIAYVSDESGIDEVYIASYPGLFGKKAVSNGGGTEPRWSPDGSELFFRSDDRMMAARISAGSEATSSRPVELFRGRFSRGAAFLHPDYDVSREGRFLMIEAEEQATGFNLVFNWFEELERLVPSGR